MFDHKSEVVERILKRNSLQIFLFVSDDTLAKFKVFFYQRLFALISALIGSCTIGTTFLLSMISGIVSDRFGIRVTTFIGGAIACSAVFMSSFFTDNVRKFRKMLLLIYRTVLKRFVP